MLFGINTKTLYLCIKRRIRILKNIRKTLYGSWKASPFKMAINFYDIDSNSSLAGIQKEQG